MKQKSLSCVWFFVTQWIQSMEFSRPEYWSRLPCPPPGNLPNPGIKSRSPTLQVILYQLSHQGSPRILEWVEFSSVQFSRSVTSDSLRLHGLQHARPPCPSPTPRAYLNSCPLNWWWHPTISSPVIRFSSHLQSFPHQGLFQWVSSSHQVAKVL